MREIVYNDDDRQYLQMMQSNIERMANNSANCKTWLTTIVAGFLAIGCSVTAFNGWIFLSLLPICMFWYLDGYYLSLERGMRNRERYFLNEYGKEDFDYKKALYDFSTLTIDEDDGENGYVKTKHCWWTRSVLPFYASLFVVVILVILVLNRSEIRAFLYSNANVCH